MSLGYSPRIGAAMLYKGTNFEYIWDGAVLEQTYLAALVGGKNEAEAKEFLTHASTAQSLANLAKYSPYGPARKSSIDIIENGEPWFEKKDGTRENIMRHLPTNPKVLKRAVIADPKWWANNGDEVNKKYKAWVESIEK